MAVDRRVGKTERGRLGTEIKSKVMGGDGCNFWSHADP